MPLRTRTSIRPGRHLGSAGRLGPTLHKLKVLGSTTRIHHETKSMVGVGGRAQYPPRNPHQHWLRRPADRSTTERLDEGRATPPGDGRAVIRSIGDDRRVALTSTAVDEFLQTPKVVPATQRMSWRRRNESIVYSRLAAQAGGAVVGELVLIVSLVVARDWKFKLLRRGEEVLRWDLTSPPARHSNPPGRPSHFPGKVRSLEHEHQWVDGFALNCALPLDLTQGPREDHRQALVEFCDRATITFEAVYEPPPPPGEQLQLG